MNKIKNKLISRKLIYWLTISMAIIGILFVTCKMFPKVQLAVKGDNKAKAKYAQLKIATVQQEKNNLTSRASFETRTTLVEKQQDNVEIKELQKDEENENKEVAKNNNESIEKETVDTKKEDSKEKTTETKKENKKSATKTKYISINNVKISKTMDLTVRTGLSREDFIKLISRVKQDTSGFFEDNAGTIYDLCEKYSINEIFFCGLISAESGWNIASNHRRTYNYISLMKNGKLIQYSSVKNGLEVAAKKLHDNYLTPGGKFYHGKTLKAVKTNFCPASSTWVDLVYGRMKQIV